MDSTTKKKMKYAYTPLNELRMNSRVNVFGVVKFLKQPYKTRGSDYCMLLSLVDESLQQPDDGVKCLLFAKREELLPATELGNIVRFHRLQISEFHGCLQGQSSPGFSWVLFSGDTAASLEPIKVSTANAQITDEDREQVSRLRHWASGKQGLVEKLSTFYQVGVSCYFDLVCQVVSVAVVEPEVCLLLRVWDGTRTIYTVKSLEKETDTQEMATDLLLEERAENLLYDVFVYDNHVSSAKKVKPGSFIKLINLHAAEYKTKDNEGNQSTLATIEFVLHRGDSFGRGIQVLSSESPSVKSLVERLDKFTLPNFSSDFEISDNTSALGSAHTNQNRVGNSDDGSEDRTTLNSAQMSNTNQNRVSGTVEDVNGDGREGLDDDRDKGEKNTVGDVPDIQSRCMLQTKTVILNHPHTQKTSIQTVLAHKGPGKFRVCAQVIAYHPTTELVTNLVKLYCPACHYLCDIPQESSNNAERHHPQLKVGRISKGLPQYVCPDCQTQTDGSPDSEKSSHLSYVFMLRFIMKDATGMLMANIWGSDAQVLFKDTEPEEVVQSVWQFSQIRQLLQEICPSDVPSESRPWIECCLRSYTVDKQIHYQIFDTAIV